MGMGWDWIGLAGWRARRGVLINLDVFLCLTERDVLCCALLCSAGKGKGAGTEIGWDIMRKKGLEG